MPLQDKQGRAWAHSSTIKAGDMLRTDGGFTCLGEGVVIRVEDDKEHEGLAGLYISCDDGRHYVEAQVGDEGELVGLYPATP